MSNTTFDPESQSRNLPRETQDENYDIFQASLDSMIILAMDGQIVDANNSACALYGYEHSEMVQLAFAALLHPDYLETVGEMVHAIGTGKIRESTQLRVRKDGSVVSTECRASPFLYRGRHHILSVERDISARVKAETELREREEQYRRIFESTSDGLIINDPLRGIVVEANPAVCRMHGYTYEEFVGLHGTAFIHPDYHGVFADFVDTISRGGTYQAQAVDTRKDGSSFPIEVHGSQVLFRGRPHILAVVRDITDRMQARTLLEQRVEEQTRELATLLDVSRNVASTTELQPLMGIILDHLKSVVDYGDAGILVRDGALLRPIGYRGPLPQDVAMQLRFPIDPTMPSWDVMELHETVLIEDVRGSTALAEKYRNAVGGKMDTDFRFIGTHLAVPMLYKGQVIGALTLSHPEPGFFTPEQATLVHAIAQQAAIAIENARLYREAQKVAAVEERQRLARELHDSVTQALFSMTLHARTASLQLDRAGIDAGTPLAQTINQLGELTQGALAEMRALIFELRPGALRDEGLVAALHKHTAALSAREQLQISVRSSEDRLTLHPDTEEHLYRLVQEALHNIVKHARASTVQVSIETAGGGSDLVLVITDDGVGFDVAALTPGHLGLTTMVERAHLAGGTLDISSDPGQGTSIRVVLPYPVEAPDLSH
ncbi:MAG: hypothetical protein NVS2B16_22320 [Chloroflexota bacterium]